MQPAVDREHDVRRRRLAVIGRQDDRAACAFLQQTPQTAVEPRQIDAYARMGRVFRSCLDGLE